MDTTISVDRAISFDPVRLDAIEILLANAELVTCSFSKLEYKRVVIQNYSLCLQYLVDEGSFAKALVKATSLQMQRRQLTLVNILAYIHDQVGQDTIDVPLDEPLNTIITSRAISYLRNLIRSSWRAFDSSVGLVVDRMSCQRAREEPREIKGGKFDVTVHQSYCKNKTCNVANFFQANLPLLRIVHDTLKSLPVDLMTKELTEIAQSIDDAMYSPERLFNYNECLRMGDLWLHLECAAENISEFATRNRKESEVLCKTLNLTMRTPGDTSS